MSESGVNFHRLEEYSDPRTAMATKPEVTVSFKTQRFGYLQVRYTENGLRELDQEPNLHMFKQQDRLYIQSVAKIVFRMVYDTPAAKERFETVPEP